MSYRAPRSRVIGSRRSVVWQTDCSVRDSNERLARSKAGIDRRIAVHLMAVLKGSVEAELHLASRSRATRHPAAEGGWHRRTALADDRDRRLQPCDRTILSRFLPGESRLMH